MKALLTKLVAVALFAMAMVGCAGTSLTAGGMNKHGGALLSYQDNNGQPVQVMQHGGGLRAAPCEPFRAEGLMHWATELEGSSHQKRSAKVSNDNGRINCHSSESAGSQQGTAIRRAPQSTARPATGPDRYPAIIVEMQ